MKRNILFASLIALFMGACSNSSTENTNNTAADSNAVIENNSADSALPGSPMTDTLAASMGVNPSQQSVITTSQTGEGMNPAHGQPGHRCDIAVGAPLNSKPNAQPAAPQTISAQPAITTTPATTPAPTTITTQPAVATQPAITEPAKTVTAPGMNPPHGEPGHDCKIAVGAPLKK